jgi:hypothetical protein
MARKPADAPRLFTPPGPPPPVQRVRRGVDATVAALRQLGRLEPVDAALVNVARTLADAMDAEHADPDGSRFVVASIAGKLVPVLGLLRGGGGGVDDDDLAALFGGALPHAPQS